MYHGPDKDDDDDDVFVDVQGEIDALEDVIDVIHDEGGWEECLACGGTGQVMAGSCPECLGAGEIYAGDYDYDDDDDPSIPGIYGIRFDD